MKQIYFIRHAKAEQDGKYGERDFWRNLSKRGQKDALKMAIKLAKVTPEWIFVSGANRTRQTAEIIAKKNAYKCEIKSIDKIYNIDAQGLMDFIYEIDESLNIVFVVGHNPAITQICEYLSGAIIGNVPTCGIFGVAFDAKFKELKASSCDVVMFEYPKKGLS